MSAGINEFALAEAFDEINSLEVKVDELKKSFSTLVAGRHTIGGNLYEGLSKTRVAELENAGWTVCNARIGFFFGDKPTFTDGDKLRVISVLVTCIAHKDDDMMVMQPYDVTVPDLWHWIVSLNQGTKLYKNGKSISSDDAPFYKDLHVFGPGVAMEHVTPSTRPTQFDARPEFHSDGSFRSSLVLASDDHAGVSPLTMACNTFGFENFIGTVFSKNVLNVRYGVTQNRGTNDDPLRFYEYGVYFGSSHDVLIAGTEHPFHSIFEKYIHSNSGYH